jgi:hypothetical protein
MSKLDSAYDIDPLFHKMSKSFDEGGAKGLLLGNLGVSSKGCHIVFDSKEEFGEEQTSKDADEQKLEGIDEENEEDTDGEEEERFNIDPEDAVVWKESEIDITSLAVKLENMLHAYGAKSSDSVPFVPQLESLRNDYAALEEEGFAEEKDVVGNTCMMLLKRKRRRPRRVSIILLWRGLVGLCWECRLIPTLGFRWIRLRVVEGSLHQWKMMMRRRTSVVLGVMESLLLMTLVEMESLHLTLETMEATILLATSPIVVLTTTLRFFWMLSVMAMHFTRMDRVATVIMPSLT